MKPIYASPADEYIALHDQASDEWVLSHRAEFDAMCAEMFPTTWRPGLKGTTLERIQFLNRQCAIKAGFPSWSDWLRQSGHPTPTEERASA